MTSWRPSLRVQWLGWTVVFGLVLAGSVWLSPRLPFPASVFVWNGLPPIAAFLIGARFKSEWWGWGPPAAFLMLVTTGILWARFGPQIPVQTSFGRATPRVAYLENPSTFIVLFFGFPLISALLAVSAYAGVRWGQRREDEAAFRDADRSDVDLRSG